MVWCLSTADHGQETGRATSTNTAVDDLLPVRGHVLSDRHVVAEEGGRAPSPGRRARGRGPKWDR